MQITVDLLYQEIGKLHITSVALRQEVASLQTALNRTAEAQETTQDDSKDE